MNEWRMENSELNTNVDSMLDTVCLEAVCCEKCSRETGCYNQAGRKDND